MATSTFRVAFADKNFATGKTINIKIYDNTGILVFNGTATEWVVGSGVYYVQTNLTTSSLSSFLVIATDSGTWKAAKLLTNKDAL